jgi:hypothetical protein
LLLVASCGGEPQPIDPPPEPVSASGWQFFRSDGSPWTTPVPDDAPVDPHSREYVAELSNFNPVVSVRQFSVPVYLAHEATSHYTIEPTADYAPPGYVLENVPIPDRAAPDPEEDGHMAVLDEPSNCVYEFYRAQRTGYSWTAEWVNVTPAEGDGIYPDGLSSRASGFSVAAGLIWPDELREGWIPHALVFAYPSTRADVTVGPATRTDGRSYDPASLPIGAHLRLDPSIDIDSLGLGPTERTIAVALQEFGMVLADSSGGFTLYAAHPQSFAADPYENLFGNVDYAGIHSIPFHRMQVLSLGELKERYTGPPIENRCNADAVD